MIPRENLESRFRSCVLFYVLDTFFLLIFFFFNGFNSNASPNKTIPVLSLALSLSLY